MRYVVGCLMRVVCCGLLVKALIVVRCVLSDDRLRCALCIDCWLFALVVRCLLVVVWWLLVVVLFVVVLFVVYFVPRSVCRTLFVDCRLLIVAWCLSFDVCMLLFNEFCVLIANCLRGDCCLLTVAVRNVLSAVCYVLLRCWLQCIAICCLMCVACHVQCDVCCLSFVVCMLFDVVPLVVWRV